MPDRLSTRAIGRLFGSSVREVKMEFGGALSFWFCCGCFRNAVVRFFCLRHEGQGWS